MWWLYYNYNNEASIELETEKENMKLLFGFSIISTIVMVRHFLKQSLAFRDKIVWHREQWGFLRNAGKSGRL